MTTYFSRLNNTNYILPSETLINSSILPNLIRNGFAPIKVFNKNLNQSIIVWLSKSKSSILIMPSKK